MTSFVRAAFAVALAALPLSACGKMGDLERPGPGNGRVAAPQRQDPTRPVRTLDPRRTGGESITPAPGTAAPPAEPQ
ncbi:LPS translocon maturation chaperone LptM [Phenylobacterium deserti]|uniref:Argininosuccinate lyase n=1 Tax=Phenylobacterium deserti TaxID=1914756 RepID=A0A328AWM3_9CAUL|nr:hypothetical protein [Phenylobacterium deserti]RAK58116.1 hypothetical protein DJ018_09480 [Phenylobacterium deserti]